jgi:hypothetical protein
MSQSMTKFSFTRTKKFLEQRIWDITFHFLLGSNVAKLCQEQKEHKLSPPSS